MYILLFKEGLEINTYGFSDLINYIVSYFNDDVYRYEIVSLSERLYIDIRLEKIKNIKENDIIIMCEEYYDYFMKLIEKSKVKYKNLYKMENGSLKRIEKRNKELS